MHAFVALRHLDEHQESFDNVLAALQADDGVVLQWSIDKRKEGQGGTSATIFFFAEPGAEQRLFERMEGWVLNPVRRLKDAPDNNSDITYLGTNNAAYTDYRVHQPEVTDDADTYLLVKGKASAGADFNTAAAALLKQSDVRLTWWADETRKPQSGLTGMFTVAANDRAAVDKVAQKLPGWTVSKQPPAPK